MPAIGMDSQEPSMKATCVLLGVIAAFVAAAIGVANPGFAKYRDSAPNSDKCGAGTMVGEKSVDIGRITLIDLGP